MLIKKATDIPRDTWWKQGKMIVVVIAIVDGFIVYREKDKKPKILAWPKFIEKFLPLPEEERPERFCRCGCGYKISQFSPRHQLYKNDQHKGIYYRRLKREQSAM